jgi:hypothetical protein
MVNPLGAIVIFDGEVPRTFTATAAADISGGQLVVCGTGAANAVGSSISSYVATDIAATPIKDGDYCNGIALQNVSSGTNNLVTIATRGSYLMRCGGIVSGGQTVIAGSATLQHLLPNGISGTAAANVGTVIGRALTPSASGTNLYSLVSLNL